MEIDRNARAAKVETTVVGAAVVTRTDVWREGDDTEAPAPFVSYRAIWLDGEGNETEPDPTMLSVVNIPVR